MWPTPTPRPTSDATASIQLDQPAQDAFIGAAEESVQLWNTANQSGALSGVQVLLIILVLWLAFRNILKRVKEL
jgi:hypothetical protein